VVEHLVEDPAPSSLDQEDEHLVGFLRLRGFLKRLGQRMVTTALVLLL
jgi:hypothetical protein